GWSSRQKTSIQVANSLPTRQRASGRIVTGAPGGSKACGLWNVSLQTEEHPPVDRGGVVDAVVIADQALPEAAQVEQLVPVRAVTGEPGDVIRKYDPYIAERDPTD